MILIDAGPLVALFDQNDGKHLRCMDTFERIKEPITTTVPVLTEAFYMLVSAVAGVSELARYINRGGLGVFYLDDELIARMLELMAQYEDRPMDFADASLVAAAERLGTQKIFTIDRNDFSTYRIRRGHRHVPFEILA